MIQTIGYINEKLGRSINKAMLLKSLGKHQIEVPVLKKDWDKQKLAWMELDATTQKFKAKYAEIYEKNADGTIKTEWKEIPKYRVVASTYFQNSQQLWKLKADGQEHSYLLSILNTSYERGGVKVQFIDFDTGHGVNMSGACYVPEIFSPLKHSVAIDVAHIKAFAAQNKAQVAWAFLIIGLVMGAFIGFTIAQNLPAIQQAASGIGATPAPVLIP